MSKDIQFLIKDINKIDLEDICSDWKWLLDTQKQVILVSCIGDLFLLGEDNTINWLEVGTGELNTVAENIEEFKQLLLDVNNIDNWFLPGLVEQLISSGKMLKENEVYSFKVIPALGGDYSIDNFEATDISVHFSITGQVHKQIWDIKEDTKITKITIHPSSEE